MSGITKQLAGAAFSALAATWGAMKPEMTAPTAWLAGLFQVGLAMNAGPALERIRFMQAGCLSDAAEQIKQATVGNEVELSPRQLEVCSEIIRTVGETIDENKLAYLKNGLVNTVLSNDDDVSSGRYALARIIRDITVHEIQFLIKNRDKTSVQELPSQEGIQVQSEQIVRIDDDHVAYVDSNKDPGLIAALTMFGVITPTGTWRGGSYFTPLREELCKLVMPADTH